MKKLFALLALFLIAIVAGCVGRDSDVPGNNTTVEEQGSVAIAMKDKPIAGVGEASAVTLNVRSIQVHRSGETSATEGDDTEVEARNWITVFSGSKQINLLEYTGNTSLLFAERDLEVGKYQQIRLYVENGSITATNTSTNTTATYNLNVPKVVKINRGFDVEENKTTLLTLDWDLEGTIKSEADGYSLRPVINIEEEHNVNITARANIKIDTNVGVGLGI